jgi:hypothetical protein
MKREFLSFLAFLFIAAGASAEKTLEPANIYPTGIGLVFKECEGYYRGDKYDETWRIPEGIIEYPGILEITLFAYDETVDPAFEIIGLNDNIGFDLDERSDNYEHKAIPVGQRNGVALDECRYIRVLSHYSGEFRYYLSCIYRSEGKAIALGSSQLVSSTRLSEKERALGKEIRNNTGKWSRLDVVLWLPDPDRNYRVKELNDNRDIRLEVYDVDGWLRKTSAIGTKYRKVLSLDACRPDETFTVLVRIEGRLAEKREGDPQAISPIPEPHTEYWPGGDGSRYRMMHHFIPYGERISKDVYVSGSFPEIQIPQVRMAFTRTISGSVRPMVNVYEIPVYEQIDENFQDMMARENKNTLRTEKKGLSLDTLWELEISRTSGSESKGDYLYRLRFDAANQDLPPFVTSRNFPRIPDKAIEYNGTLKYLTDRVAWWRLEPSEMPQQIKVVWSDEDSELDVDVYSEEGDFERRAVFQKEEMEDSSYQKVLFIEPGKRRYLAASLNSAADCSYGIFREAFEMLAEKGIVKVMDKGHSQRYGWISKFKGNSIELYQSSPSIRLTVSNGKGKQWKQDDNASYLYQHYVLNGDRIFVTLENISSSPVEYWLKAREISDARGEQPVNQYNGLSADRDNDSIWNAEHIIDLTGDRICCAEGSINPYSGDSVDYWKINMAGNLVDSPKPLRFTIESEEDLRVEIYPGIMEHGETRRFEYIPIDGVYTYYIRIQACNPVAAGYSFCIQSDSNSERKTFVSIEEEIK